jgi:hypothetical protein
MWCRTAMIRAPPGGATASASSTAAAWIVLSSLPLRGFSMWLPLLARHGSRRLRLMGRWQSELEPFRFGRLGRAAHTLQRRHALGPRFRRSSSGSSSHSHSGSTHQLHKQHQGSIESCSGDSAYPPRHPTHPHPTHHLEARACARGRVCCLPCLAPLPLPAGTCSGASAPPTPSSLPAYGADAYPDGLAPILSACVCMARGR